MPRSIVHGPTVVLAYTRNRRVRKAARPQSSVTQDELDALMADDNDDLIVLLNEDRMGDTQDRMERETAVALRLMREVG